MQSFSSSRDAKEFLVSSIVTQANGEGVPLSEIERKMLYFTETGWTLPDMAEVNDSFDRDYDQEEYERKIGSLSRNFCADVSANNAAAFERWNTAVQTLSVEDHYILVLIGAAGQPATNVRLPFWMLVGALAAGAVVYFVTRG
ncbi:MAG TPA: hypothetical protein VJU82_18060 [Acidobacteriaceae bacterium]|nr:hypothetical protein [Acidobacteriaceae bacterium]